MIEQMREAIDDIQKNQATTAMYNMRLTHTMENLCRIVKRPHLPSRARPDSAPAASVSRDDDGIYMLPTGPYE